MGDGMAIEVKQDWVQDASGVWRITVAGEWDLRLINNRRDRENELVTDLVLVPRS